MKMWGKKNPNQPKTTTKKREERIGLDTSMNYNSLENMCPGSLKTKNLITFPVVNILLYSNGLNNRINSEELQ